MNLLFSIFTYLTRQNRFWGVKKKKKSLDEEFGPEIFIFNRIKQNFFCVTFFNCK